MAKRHTKDHDSFDLSDPRVLAERALEIHKYGLTAYWLVISPVECQAIAAGLVPSDVALLAAQLLAPDRIALAVDADSADIDAGAVVSSQASTRARQQPTTKEPG